MTSSAHEGKAVVFIDAIRMRHEGVIVGQSEDGSLTYVRSTKMDSGRAWDFSIRTESLDQYLVS